MAPKKCAAPESVPSSKKIKTSLDTTPRRVTRSMTIDAPRQAALNTTEILENIISYLPNRTVFGVQRVCRQWRDVIAGSPTIRDKLFLRLRGQTPETWLLTNPVSFDRMYHSGPFDIRSIEKKFRMANVTDMEAAKVKSSDRDINWNRIQLFTPVTLNPLPSWWDVAGQRIEEEVVKHGASFTTRGKLAQFAEYGSAKAAFITDPPCNEIKVMLDYEARPPCPGFYFLGCKVKFRSDKPLTIADAIDRALETKTMWTLDTKHQEESTDVTDDITAAEKIVQLEKQHKCRIVLEAFYITLSLNDTIIRPLPLSGAEYPRYRPKGDEPIEDDSSESDSSESDSSEDDTSRDGSAEGEPTEDEPTEQ